MNAALDPQRWKQLRPLLEQALDLDDKGRAQLLQELSQQGSELRADLLRLLQHHGAALPELEQPAARLLGQTLLAVESDVAPRPAPYLGRQIGAFRLQRLIGRGGMGSVYAAERITGGFSQTVAIKLITGLHPGLLERFANERQILANLRHPHIAQLLDGGETSDGLPYFAMEYIEGLNLHDHCISTGADLDSRLALLVDVAAALGYAHQRKLIHRDIKPGNILVSADGQVKLLDFGIAKLLDDTGQPALTHQTVGPMTPAYAAPEQFRGQPLSAATDIYQFGVLSFRLLSGRSPYRTEGHGALELARAVSDEQPLSLFTAIKMEAARDSRPLLDLTERRNSWNDLDLILQHCLEKDPARRYPDMAALIVDLQAVRQRLAPKVRGARQRRHGWRWLLAAAGLGLLCLAWLLVARLQLFADPWRTEPALYAFGLERRLLHTSSAQTESWLRQAFFKEAAGDLAGAKALFETTHEADPVTPIPAMFLSFWANTPEQTQLWRQRAADRLAPLNDAELELLSRYMDADADSALEETLRYSAAVLELHPNAWFLHLARAHRLGSRGLREAALRELQQIDTTRLGHRRLSAAIADRASFGDLAGARALAGRLQTEPQDPDFALLKARLSFSGGELADARIHFLEAVQYARKQARFDIEGRGQMYVGLVEGSLGNYVAADTAIRAARVLFQEREQVDLAIDASLVLAQLGERLKQPGQIADEIEAARKLLLAAPAPEPQGMAPLVELSAARLLRRAPSLDAEVSPDVRALIEARREWLAGDSTAATASTDRAQREGADLGPLAEEYRLLRHDLGQSVGELPALDPPFQPYTRFSARWAMGKGGSVVRAPAP